MLSSSAGASCGRLNPGVLCVWGSYRHNTGSRTGVWPAGVWSVGFGNWSCGSQEFILNPVTSEWDCFHSSQPLQGLPDARTDLAVHL